MFKTYDGGTILGDMLISAGMNDFGRLELLPAWTVFKAFVKLPFVTESDGILVEWGISPYWVTRDGVSVKEREEFYFHFCRQLQEPGEDEYVQIFCQFRYVVSDTLRQHGHKAEWWFTTYPTSHDEFFAEIAALAVFQDVAANHRPEKTGAGLDSTG